MLEFVDPPKILRSKCLENKTLLFLQLKQFTNQKLNAIILTAKKQFSSGGNRFENFLKIPLKQVTSKTILSYKKNHYAVKKEVSFDGIDLNIFM